MGSSIKQLWDLVSAAGDGRYAPARVREQLVVSDTVSDSSGTTTQARGSIDGAGDFTVDVRGKGIRAGMTIGVTRPLDDPTAPLAFDGIDASDDPTAGYADTDPNLPAPAFDAPPYTTSVVASPGSVASRLTVNFLAVAAKYAPSQYLVSWRYPSATGPWADVIVPHLGGSQVCALPPVFPPGAAVDLKLRARYAWAHADSVPSAVVTATVAADNGTPGTASTVTVSNATPGQLLATVTASTVDQALFSAWRYEFSTSATGPATATIQTNGQAVYTGAAGNYWVRAAPVSKSGTVGTFTGWTGPTSLLAPASLDQTPPAAWTVAPTLADSSYIDGQGVWHGNVRVGLPSGHTFEPDYAYTLARVQNLATGLVAWYRLEGNSLGPMEVAVATAGASGAMAIVADVVGVDRSGNRLATYSPQATVTVTAPGVPTGTLTATVAQRALGLLVSWSGVTGATWYEVWRSAASSGTSPTLLSSRVEGGGYFDPLADQTVILPTYYYQVKSFNAQGAGPVSQTPWPGQATLPADAGNLRQNSITAAQVAADTAIFNKIVALDTIVANSIVTADIATATQVIRMSGPNGADPNTITFWEKVSGAWTRRIQHRGTGMYVYNDDGSVAASFARDANGRAALTLNGISLYNAASGLGVSEIRLEKAVARFIGPGYAGTSYWDFRAGIAGGPPDLAAGNCLALTSTIGTTDAFAVGSLNADGSGKLQDGIVLRPRAGGTSYIGFLPGNAAQPFADVMLSRSGPFASVSVSLTLGNASGVVGFISGDHITHRNNDTGAIFLGNSQNHYVFWSGTEYVMPGGPVRANGVVLTSARDQKRDIGDLPSMAEVVRRLRPRRFRRREYGPTGPEEFGFVAEEVAALLPSVVRDIDLTPATRRDGQGAGVRSQGIDYFPLLTACVRGFQELLAAQEQRLDDLTARLARLESQTA